MSVKIHYEKEVHTCSECAFFVLTDGEYHPSYCRLLKEISELQNIEYLGDYQQYWECTEILKIDPNKEVSLKCPFNHNFKYYTIESRKTNGVINNYTIHDDKSAVEFYGKENLRKNGVFIDE